LTQGQLRYFVAVAEEGQITRAARKLHLAQPALSQAIAQLESDLDVELFVRHPRGMTLTPAGEAMLEKARAVLAAEAETARTALALRRVANSEISVGFIGPPPAIAHPDLLTAFSERNPQAQISFRDLQFPRGATSNWLADVDVAVCHTPKAEASVSMQPIRVEPRAAVMHRGHPLAGRTALAVMDVIDETFIGYHPAVQPIWAGFHSLDDHRGCPPEHRTGDEALTSLQMLGIMSSPRALTTVPYADAKLAMQVLPEIASVPIVDAAPAVVSLVWQRDAGNPLIDDLVEIANRLRPPSDEF
jgi:DNA-binding transcriptional LysR family regulator